MSVQSPVEILNKSLLLVGYDRLVDYVDDSSRETEDTAVEISSNESSDSEVLVIDDISPGSSNLVQNDLSENIPTEVIVESDSDNSEVIFVLALKPPEQRM